MTVSGEDNNSGEDVEDSGNELQQNNSNSQEERANLDDSDSEIEMRLVPESNYCPSETTVSNANTSCRIELRLVPESNYCPSETTVSNAKTSNTGQNIDMSEEELISEDDSANNTDVRKSDQLKISKENFPSSLPVGRKAKNIRSVVIDETESESDDPEIGLDTTLNYVESDRIPEPEKRVSKDESEKNKEVRKPHQENNSKRKVSPSKNLSVGRRAKKLRSVVVREKESESEVKERVIMEEQTNIRIPKTRNLSQGHPDRMVSFSYRTFL